VTKSPKTYPNIFLSKLIHNFYRGKSRQKFWATSVFKKLSK
jgi:hypothetical protein